MRLVLILLLIPCILTAQVNPAFVVKSNLNYPNLQAAGENLFGFEKDGKYGYMDKNEKVIIQPEYSYESTYKTIPGFSNGYAIVRKNNKVGVIDRTGKEVVPIEYDYISTINLLPGYATVRKSVNSKNQYGIMNCMQSKIVIPIEYDDLQTDSNLVSVKQNGRWGLLDITGKQMLPPEYTSLIVYAKEKVCRVEKDGKYGFIDLKGNWIFDKSKSVYSLYGPHQGLIMCVVSNKYGYLDMKGNEVIMTKYDYASSFEQIGLARVGRKNSSGATEYGYIDKKGTEIIPLKYQTLGYSFSNGLVYAKDPETNRYGFFDKTGKWAIQPVYLDVTSFDDHGGAWAKMTDAKYHYINKTGKDLGTVDEKAATSKYFGKDGFAVHESNDNSYVLIDNTGKIISKIDDCDAVYNYSEGIGGYKCKSNSKYGFIDINGKKLTTCDFDGFAAFTEYASKVDKVVDGKTKSGYIDTKGNIILPLVYDNVYAFRNGWGLIKKDGNYFFVDKNGNLKEPPAKYDELNEFRSGYAMGKIKGEANGPNKYVYINPELKEEFTVSASQAFPIWETVAIVSSDNKNYELMNKKGNIFKVLTGVEQVNFCTDGMLGIREKGKWGYVNDKGDVIVSPKYDTCTGFKYGYGRVRSGGKWGIVDRSGTEIFATKYENILPGENGYFIFYNNGWGMMDKTGKIIIPPTMGSITPFEKNRAMAKTGKTYAIIRSPLAR